MTDTTIPADTEPHVTDYLQWADDLVLSSSTVETYRLQLAAYTDFLEENELEVPSATLSDVTRYVEECVRAGNRQSTLEAKVTIINQLYQHIFLRMDSVDDLSMNPLELKSINLEKYRTPEAITREALSREEVRKLFDAIPSYRNWLLLVTGVETGLRNSDLRELTIDDVDTDELVVTPQNPKGGIPYTVPISDNLAFEFENWIQGQRSGYGGNSESNYLFPAQTKAKLERNGSLNRIVKDAAERADIQNTIGTSELTDTQQEAFNTEKSVREWNRVTVHTLRHTYLTLLKEAEVPLRYRQQVANHRNPETTKTYTHGDRAAFEKIRESFEPPR